MLYIYLVVIVVRVNLADEYWKEVYIFYLLNSILKICAQLYAIMRLIFDEVVYYIPQGFYSIYKCNK